MFPALEWFIIRHLKELGMPRRRLLRGQYVELFFALYAIENALGTLTVMGASKPAKAISLLISAFPDDFERGDFTATLFENLRSCHADWEAKALASPELLPWQVALERIYGALSEDAIDTSQEISWDSFGSDNATSNRAWPGIQALYYGLVNPSQLSVWLEIINANYGHLRDEFWKAGFDTPTGPRFKSADVWSRYCEELSDSYTAFDPHLYQRHFPKSLRETPEVVDRLGETRTPWLRR